MKYLKYILLGIVLTFSLTGCVSSAQPNSVNGKYYMMGDSSCSRYKVISPNKVMCYDTNGRATGWRKAMTNQELQIYMHRQSQANYAYQQRLNRSNYSHHQMLNRTNYNRSYIRY